jgi:hypothetical protein
VEIFFFFLFVVPSCKKAFMEVCISYIDLLWVEVGKRLLMTLDAFKF